LLRRIVETPGAFRIRLSSLECNELSEDLLRLVADSDKIAPHLHLPLQSGSARVLTEMGRRYSPAAYARWVELAARLMPGRHRADVIVGFPTEGKRISMKRSVSSRGFPDLSPCIPVFPKARDARAAMKARAPERSATLWAARLKRLGG